MIEFTIPARTPTLNEWQRMHWGRRKRIGINLAWLIREAYGPLPKTPLSYVDIEVWRESPQEPDADGAIGGLKPLVDALQPVSKRHPYGLGMICDDGPRHVRSLKFNHVQGRGQRTRVVITEVG